VLTVLIMNALSIGFADPSRLFRHTIRNMKRLA